MKPRFFMFYGLIWMVLSIKYLMYKSYFIWSFRLGEFFVWFGLILVIIRIFKKWKRKKLFKPFKAKSVLNFFAVIFVCRFIGLHSWTCKAAEGIDISKEETEAGMDGFWHYAKMYCARCSHESELNHPTDFGKK